MFCYRPCLIWLYCVWYLSQCWSDLEENDITCVIDSFFNSFIFLFWIKDLIPTRRRKRSTHIKKSWCLFSHKVLPAVIIRHCLPSMGGHQTCLICPPGQAWLCITNSVENWQQFSQTSRSGPRFKVMGGFFCNQLCVNFKLCPGRRYQVGPGRTVWAAKWCLRDICMKC